MTNKKIKEFAPLIDAIAETFGKNCEVVLHDLSKPEHSIIKIANGHVTGREVGSPITNLALSLMKKNSAKKDSLIGYKTVTKKGVELKSTTIFIKDSKGKIIGALCINIDITNYVLAKNALEEISKISTPENGITKESPEKFETNVDTLINEMIEQAVQRIGKPIVQMDRDNKLEIIRNLKEKGLFMIKGSAIKVSKELSVSLASIYKYLEEVKEV
jgi:predicted transcriptional regulator YheO